MPAWWLWLLSGAALSVSCNSCAVVVWLASQWAREGKWCSEMMNFLRRQWDHQPRISWSAQRNIQAPTHVISVRLRGCPVWIEHVSAPVVLCLWHEWDCYQRITSSLQKWHEPLSEVSARTQKNIPRSGKKKQLVRNLASDVLCRIHNYMHLRRFLVVDDSNPAENSFITRFNDCK